MQKRKTNRIFKPVLWMFLFLLVALLPVPTKSEQAAPPAPAYDDRDAIETTYVSLQAGKIISVFATTHKLYEHTFPALHSTKMNGGPLPTSSSTGEPCCEQPVFSRVDRLYWHKILDDGSCELSVQSILVCDNCNRLACATSPQLLEHTRGDGKYPGKCVK